VPIRPLDAIRSILEPNGRKTHGQRRCCRVAHSGLPVGVSDISNQELLSSVSLGRKIHEISASVDGPGKATYYV